jgi:PPK2 family polyphosphate:nucleotide phosphotransferase
MKEAVLFEPIASPYLVPFDGSFELAKARTEAADDPGKGENKDALQKAVEKLCEQQERLYANDQYSVLLIFQALDAAGKDGTVRAILTGVNPAGVQVSSFKAPSVEELDHDFMWRCYKQLPERGRIGVWNRSHYEETLVVRVHPSFLDGQRLPRRPNHIEDLWAERFESINAFERHWARNGTIVLKFFLNVSQKEQHERFLDRVKDPDVNWKFNSGDLDESKKWPEYMAAYEAVLRTTSKPWAPWYVIPADGKPYMRRACADIIVKTLSQIEMPLPQLTEKDRAALETAKAALEAEMMKKKKD